MQVGARPAGRLGVDSPPEHMDARDYVLSPFPASDHDTVEDLVYDAADAVELVLSEGIETGMNEIN